MQSSPLAAATAFFGFVATGAFALPASVQERDVTPIYGPTNPVIGSVCPAPSSPQPGAPAYPVASALGSIISPALDALVGHPNVESFDKMADELCISAQQDPTASNGICQETFSAARDFVDAQTPLDQSKQFGCLLDLICVAHAGPANEGTCNQLLAASDCIANRIVGVQNLECY